MRTLLVALAIVLLTNGTASAADGNLKVGSKRFVESYILAEIVAQLARAEGVPAQHEQGLGGTAVLFRALETNAVAVYPEYTGTLAEVGIKSGSADLPALRAAMAQKGLGVSEPLGFENTYALAVRRELATRLGLSKVSDLRTHPELRLALSQEFIGRRDGWPGLAERYALHPPVVQGFDHALAYEALNRGEADVIDVYTTDAKIERFDLVVLADDLHFFPPYQAVLVYRLDLPPAFTRVLEKLHGRIDAKAMQRMNAQADLDGVPFAKVAESFIAGTSTRPGARIGLFQGTLDVIRKNGPRHLMLVMVSLAMSIFVGLPLGILAYARRRIGVVVLGLAGIVQTIPSLALFCFFIPLLGIGPVPALAALFLYGLLPIVRNTHAGLVSIPSELREAAVAIGLSPMERLRHVELPLASRTILAGIKTSAVVAVGSATIAAFIGAGGFGEPISTGLSLNDVTTILEGAIPAAAMALLVEAAFILIERAVVPRPLRTERPQGE
jgi:osmoprotectant transport system permease protein